MSRGCHFDEGNQFITGVFDLDLGCDDEGGGGVLSLPLVVAFFSVELEKWLWIYLSICLLIVA